ncbi:hypothetical protein C7S20_19440 [Christiangramia fulva]|uniref:Uncharacterized protein n=1 Tax=Christiangramia fulva TaxID=2126553 RepID=A0A2R3ZAI9_9FLAO|nr:hypothetical protein [Christiangramia fulva]AVR47250.1 hypothetical protein C7S20_19440 [Christiangramia fulva]
MAFKITIDLGKLRIELNGAGTIKGREDWTVGLIPQLWFGWQNYSYCKAIDLSTGWLFWWVSISIEKK